MLGTKLREREEKDGDMCGRRELSETAEGKAGESETGEGKGGENSQSNTAATVPLTSLPVWCSTVIPVSHNKPC